MNASFAPGQILSLLVQGDNSLAHELEKLDLHFCVRGGAVHFEATRSDHGLELCIEEKLTVDGAGAIQKRFYRHTEAQE
jgi:hypothetical protein